MIVHFSHRILIVWVLFILSSGVNIFGQNHTRICVIDRIHNTPIPYANIFNSDTTIMSTTDWSGNASIDIDQNSVWYVNHISYELARIDALALRDTIYLDQRVNILDGLIIIPDDHDINESLIKIIKKGKKAEVSKNRVYLFYLESRNDHGIKEKIKAIYEASSTPYNGIDGAQFVHGEFWYNFDAVFLNLDTDMLIRGFELFDDDLKWPFSLKDLKKRRLIFSETDCYSCKDNERIVSYINPKTKSYGHIKYNDYENEILEISIFNKNFAPVYSLDLSTKIRCDSISFHYKYKDGHLDVLTFNTILSDSIKVHAIYKYCPVSSEIEVPKFFSTSNVDLPRNLYDNIIVNNLLGGTKDSVLWSVYNSGIAIKNFDTMTGTNSMNNRINAQIFLNQDVNNIFTFWEQSNMNLIHFRWQGYTYDSGGLTGARKYTIKIPQNELNVAWFFKELTRDGVTLGYTGLPSIWPSAYNIIYSNDRTISQLKCLLFFSLMEIDRRSLLQKLNVPHCNDSIMVTNDIIQNHYQNARDSRWNQLDFIDFNLESKKLIKQNTQKLIKLNDFIFDELGVKVVESLYAHPVDVYGDSRDIGWQIYKAGISAFADEDSYLCNHLLEMAIKMYQNALLSPYLNLSPDEIQNINHILDHANQILNTH